MTKKDKLIERFLTLPKNFSYDEFVQLFKMFGFYEHKKGKTSGSRVSFVNDEKGLSYNAHKPHPSNVIKGYVMKQVLDFLLSNDLITKD